MTDGPKKEFDGQDIEAMLAAYRTFERLRLLMLKSQTRVGCYADKVSMWFAFRDARHLARKLDRQLKLLTDRLHLDLDLAHRVQFPSPDAPPPPPPRGKPLKVIK